MITHSEQKNNNLPRHLPAAVSEPKTLCAGLVQTGFQVVANVEAARTLDVRFGDMVCIFSPRQDTCVVRVLGQAMLGVKTRDNYIYLDQASLHLLGARLCDEVVVFKTDQTLESP